MLYVGPRVSMDIVDFAAGHAFWIRQIALECSVWSYIRTKTGVWPLYSSYFLCAKSSAINACFSRADWSPVSRTLPEVIRAKLEYGDRRQKAAESSSFTNTHARNEAITRVSCTVRLPRWYITFLTNTSKGWRYGHRLRTVAYILHTILGQNVKGALWQFLS